MIRTHGSSRFNSMYISVMVFVLLLACTSILDCASSQEGAPDQNNASNQDGKTGQGDRSDQNRAELFEQGNTLYALGGYEKALSAYEAGLRAGADPGVMHFNAGNCLFRLGRFGEALYHYCCAQHCYPRMDRIEKNMRITHERLGLAPPGQGTFVTGNFLALISSFTSVEYGIVTAFSGSVAFFLLAFYCLKRNPRHLGWVLVFLLVASLFAFLACYREGCFSSDKGMVVRAAQALNEPSAATGERSFFLAEGEKVKVRESIEGWHRIELSENRTGWVESGKIRLLPSGANP